MSPKMLLTLAACLFLHGCISAEGWKKSVWTKRELVDWYEKYERPKPRPSAFGYQGSDERYHYFITRPIDSFLMLKIPRTELTIPDERPRSRLGKQLYFYRVDPGKDFRKIPEN